jgi:hypothetical protein
MSSSNIWLETGFLSSLNLQPGFLSSLISIPSSGKWMIMFNHLNELLPLEIRRKKRAASLIRKASERNEIFYCATLAGESDFNICINSDMTVSCNCQDYDGSGRIGHLTIQALEEIFNGPTAPRFRTMLADRTKNLPYR